MLLLRGGRGRGSGLQFRMHDFVIAVGRKGPPSGPIFWSGLEATDHEGVVATPIFLPKVAHNIKL